MQKDIILKFALQNALKYGKADPKIVINKVFSELKTIHDKKTLLQEIQNIIKDINSWSVKQQRSRLQKLAPELLEKKRVEKQDLKELKNVIQGGIKTRLAPEPSKCMHIGHALVFAINYLYAEKYHGTCTLRLEDTNPEKSTQEYVDSVYQDLDWLGLKCHEKIICSDRLELYYEHAGQLITNKKAFTCFCDRDTVKTLRMKKERCACAKKNQSSILDEWRNMLAGKYKAGACNLRLIGDMTSDNGVLRDPVIMRISKAKHYRYGTKFHAWPLYDFENAIEDSVEGITHVIRSKEFELRSSLHNLIKEYLKLKKQEVIEIGRFNVIGATTQGREIRKLIETKQVSGWDDPRLVTIRALRRRGFMPETFLMLARQIGLSKSETNIDWQLLAAYNRKVLDPRVKRYFFVAHPQNIAIKNAPNLQVAVPFHPDIAAMGERSFRTETEFYIADDLKKNKNYRLMHLFNFKNNTFFSRELDQKLEAQLIHWLPVSGDLVHVEVLMPDGTLAKGLGEPSLRELRVGTIVQFPRFGFCRFDHQEKETLVFWFAHK